MPIVITWYIKEYINWRLCRALYAIYTSQSMSVARLLRNPIMQQIFRKIARNIKGIYHKAEDLIEEERELPLSQNLLNATIQKYVTDNVTALQDYRFHPVSPVKQFWWYWMNLKDRPHES